VTSRRPETTEQGDSITLPGKFNTLNHVVPRWENFAYSSDKSHLTLSVRTLADMKNERCLMVCNSMVGTQRTGPPFIAASATSLGRNLPGSASSLTVSTTLVRGRELIAAVLTPRTIAVTAWHKEKNSYEPIITGQLSDFSLINPISSSVAYGVPLDTRLPTTEQPTTVPPPCLADLAPHSIYSQHRTSSLIRRVWVVAIVTDGEARNTPH